MVQFDDHSSTKLSTSTENEKAVSFFNPFQALVESPHQSSQDREIGQGSSYFPILSGDVQNIDLQESGFINQDLQESIKLQRPTLDKRITILDPSNMPQVLKTFDARKNSFEDARQIYQPMMDDYMISDQEIVSNRIRDFDAFINSLSIQSRNDRKRAQSKTFEDIMPYLSSTTSRDSSQSIRAPIMHKRAKTQNDYCYEGRSNNENMENLGWTSNNLMRQRQRSKTNATVYEMRNRPIVPLDSSFTSLKQKLGDRHDIKMDNIAESSVGQVQSTMCAFVQQAAKSALKGAKCANELETTKRAMAGSKARDEQNREKSKRYYDRKKAQISAMSGLCSAIDAWNCKIGFVAPKDLQSEIIAKESAMIISETFILPSERQKALKGLSKIKENAQLHTIMSSATKLRQLIVQQPFDVLTQIVLRHGSRPASFSGDLPMCNAASSDLIVLESGLHIWLDFLHCWSDLIFAEKRLSGKTHERPIYQLIHTLTELL